MTRQDLSLTARLYSWWVGRRLGHRGAHTQIAFPTKIKNPERVRLGDAVVIREHGWFNCDGSGVTLTIGDRSYVGRFAHINAMASVVIENDVLIADRVHISDHQHASSDPDLPVIAQGITTPEPVRIGSGSWIGTGAVIMPGVVIGRGVIVGANAIVTTSVDDLAIVAGVPARVIGSRGHASPSE